jgi:integrase
LAFAGRLEETIAIKYGSLRRIFIDQEPAYELSHAPHIKMRAEASDNIVKFITGALYVKTIDAYLRTFGEGQREPDSRLFRKINSNMQATGQVIGKNTAAQFGKVIARTLELPFPDKYTSHCWRRSSITWMANDGLSLSVIKSVSGHTSDKVVQGYIDNSDLNKKGAAAALQVDSKKNCRDTTFESHNDSDRTLSKKARRNDTVAAECTNVTIHISNSTFTTGSSIMQHRNVTPFSENSKQSLSGNNSP